jgi:uncharacterized tellurite resistance protein B-like protein
MEIEEQQKICELIEAMISADGVIAEAEREYLRKVVARFGLPEREMGPVSASDFGRTTNMLRTLPPDVRPRVMALLVEVAVVDGNVDPQERALLLASAAALGIEATALEERIAGRLRGTGSSLPPITQSKR